MLKSYLKTTLRNLGKHKGYSFINVTGLTLGLTCCLLIFQYVAFEYSFDRFHENEDDLYRVIRATPLRGESFEPGGASTPHALAPALDQSVPEVFRVTRVHPEYNGAIVSSPARPERVFEEEQAFYVDPSFLKIFTFPLVSGSAERALQPGTMLLSESAARKYFGSENPVGKVLEWNGATEKSYRVTGVFEDVPPNSHLQFDFLLPVADLLQNTTGFPGEGGYRNAPEGGWSWNNFLTYVQLRPEADRAAVDQMMTELYRARRGEALQQQGRTARLWTQPLSDVHLSAAITAPAGVTGSYRTVYFFIVIGLVTLAIALLNYVNLATARSLDRAREIGVRKAVGAHRRQLIRQFMFESALTNVIAATLAAVLAVVLTPLVNDLAGTRLTGVLWMNPWFWLVFLGTFGMSILGAGLYPAFVLSSFDPVSVMRDKAGSFGGKLWLRKGLVVLQFAASFVLVAGTAVVYNQLHYMRTMDLGLDLEKVLTVEGPQVLPEGTRRKNALTTFTQELRRLPGVQQVATSSSLPGQGFNWDGAQIRKATGDPADDIPGALAFIDTSFTDLYGLELLAGQGFTSATVSSAGDRPISMTFIANETAVHNLGFGSPSDAVGQKLTVGGRIDAEIIGVVRDFDWTSAHEARKSVFLGHRGAGRHVSMRVSTDDLPGTLSSIEEIYRSLFPANPFSYSFLDEQFEQQYREDQRFATLFTGFAGLAILIACLGLFGLASFTAKKQRKEIGIRKVLGAWTANIAMRLSGQFMKLVLLGIVVATPVAYLAAQRWLQRFAYHIELTPWVFLGAGVLALLIALLTVSFQSIRAALTNPADTLRYE